MTSHLLPGRRVRRALAAPALALAPLTLSACGEDSASRADDDPSTSTSGDQGSEGFEPPAAGEEVDADDVIELFSTAVEQATTAEVSMTQSASGLEADGVVDYASDPIAMDLSMELLGQLGQGAIKMRLVDNVVYMKLPALGEKWVKTDLDDPGNPLGGAFTDQLDPSTMSDALAKGLQSGTYVGSEDVDGDSLDHYALVLNPMARVAGMDLPSTGAYVPKTMTMDVWFDEDGFYRQLNVEMGPLGATEMTMDNWGADVSVEAPPEDQVTQMPSLPGA